MFPRCHLNKATHTQQYDYGLLLGVESRTEMLQVLHLQIGEIVVPLLQPTVIALTGHSPDSENTHVVTLCQRLSLFMANSQLVDSGYYPKELAVLFGFFGLYIVYIVF